MTQEQVSLSLIDIVEELANHVPTSQRPQVELLCRLAREKPEQHAKVKEQMLAIAGPDAMRAAVAALIGAQAKKTAAKPPPPAPPPAPPPPAWPGMSNEPAMPPNLPAIFGSAASTPAELQDFKAELFHAFHCRAPSCPVSGCASLTSKLERLHHHVAQCNEEMCLLCSIGSYLRSYHHAAQEAAATCPEAPRAGGSAGAGCGSCGGMHGSGAGGRALSGASGGAGGGGLGAYEQDLMASCQPLPRWQDGKLMWMPPQEAMASLYASFGGDGASQRGGGSMGPMGGPEQPAKRARPSSKESSDQGTGGQGAYSGLHQGVIQTMGSNAGQLWRPNYEQPMPRVPNAAAPAPAPIDGKWRGGGGGGGGGNPPPWSGAAGAPAAVPRLPNGLEIPPQGVGFAQMVSEMALSGGFGSSLGALSGQFGAGGLSGALGGAGSALGSLSGALGAGMAGGMGVGGMGVGGLEALVGGGDPLGGGVGGGGHGRSLKRSYDSLGLDAASYARLGGGGGMGDLGGMAPLPLEASKSLNLSGNLNLHEFLRNSSLSDLGLGMGGISGLADVDLGALKSLSFSNKEQLRAANVSDLSLSGILGENASDLVANLTSPVGVHGVPRQGSHNSSAGSAQPDRDLVGELINDEPIASC